MLKEFIEVPTATGTVLVNLHAILTVVPAAEGAGCTIHLHDQTHLAARISYAQLVALIITAQQ